MAFAREHLRARQGEHALILLNGPEFYEFREKKSLPLPARHAEHFGRVLRRAQSWPAFVGDGINCIYEAIVDSTNIRLTPEKPDAPILLPPRVAVSHIAQAWIKPKALSFLLQKCAELGVDEITLFDSDNSAPHSEKPQRIDAILENACMQAYNPTKPRLSYAGSVAELAEMPGMRYFGSLGSVVWFSPNAARQQNCTFICGPEGGFSAPELERLSGFATGVLISENVLRAETAAIIAAGIMGLRK